MLFHKQSTEKVQSCVLYELSLSAVSNMYHRSWKYESILTLSVIIIIIIYSHGRAMQYSFFFVILGSLKKQCILFEINLSCSSPSPHPIQSWNSEKILDTRVQHCLWGEGRGWSCENWKTPQQRKSVPRLLPWLKLFCLDIFDQLVGFYSEPIRARRMIVNYLSFWFSFGIC